MGLRDTILAAEDAKLARVGVPEWGVTVYVPVMTLGEADQLKGLTEGENAMGRMAAYIIRDENGARMFTDDDAPILAMKSLTAMRRIIEAFNRHNGIDTEADEKN